MIKVTHKSLLVGLSLVICLAFFLSGTMAQAEEAASSEEVQLNLRAFGYELAMTKELPVFDADYPGVMDFALMDLGGDGVNEIVVAYGYQDRPQVKIFRPDGSLVNEWYPYGVGYEGKVVLATGDLNGDGREEIITSTGEGGGPHVRIFNGFAEPIGGFFADDPGYRNGTEVAVGDINGDGVEEIVVSLRRDDDVNVIKFFDGKGNPLDFTIERTVEDMFEPGKVFMFDVDDDGMDEVIVGAGLSEQPYVRVFETDGTEILSFLAYGEGFLGGVDITAGVYDGKKVIVTGASYGGGPHVRFFDLSGNPTINPVFFVYENDFRGGLSVALGNLSGGDGEVVVMPLTTVQDNDIRSFGKLLLIDLSEQRLYAYQYGRLEKSFLISSGTRAFPTPVGDFSIYRKRPITRMSWFYGPGNPNNYDLPGVKYAMSFLGPYNLHGTYWHNNFGTPMSHGCVNLSNTNAEWVYNWSPIGTKVKVQY
jgi:hypothetical protein